MKKILMVVFGMMFVCNAFAETTDIAADATTGDCDETTLGTYSGSADLEIKWEPNEIKLRWYNNNTLMQDDTVIHNNVNANTCEYDGTLSRPINPTRIGYTFAGWKVRPMMDFSTLTSLEMGTEAWGKGLNNNVDYCWKDYQLSGWTLVNCKTDFEFNTLKQHEWKIQYNSGDTKGTLYGSAHCSAKSGYNGGTWLAVSYEDWLATYNQLEEVSGTKQYCWCQATGWQPDGDSTIYANSNNLSYGNGFISSGSAWVYFIDDGDPGACEIYCVQGCMAAALGGSSFRRALFIGSGN